MFSFASNNLRASKHGNFSSVDSGRLLEERSPKMAIMRDGTKLQNVRTALLSRWITRRLDQMTTLTRRVQYIRPARPSKSSNHLLFNNDCSHGPQRHPWPQCGFYYYSPLYRGNYSRLYWRFNLKNCFLLYNQFKTSTVISDAPFPEFDQSINQSV